jgi:hypothetical protein
MMNEVVGAGLMVIEGLIAGLTGAVAFLLCTLSSAGCVLGARRAISIQNGSCEFDISFSAPLALLR